MLSSFSFVARGAVAGAALLALGAGGAAPAAAQATTKPAWATAVATPGGSQANATAVNALAADASGNVVVVGSLQGTATFGSTTLTSAGDQDVFVAKWVPATGTWAWAVRAGGTGYDAAFGVAVRGTSLYVAGVLENNQANATGVTFGALPQYGASPNRSLDAFVVKYTDAGSTATSVWTQVAGGTAYDFGNGVAVSGSSVYLTGSIANNLANSTQVVFGGSGPAAGTAAQAGAAANGANISDDLYLAKYTDNGATATFNWSQVGGGTGNDIGRAVAVSGSSVYVTGQLENSTSNQRSVRLGGSGLVAGTAGQYGAGPTSTSDLLLAKYTDNGSTGALGWTQVAGGGGYEQGYGVAASGSSVYLTGNLYNSRADAALVRFGGSGSTAGTLVQAGASAQLSDDLVLAKYTDLGSSATVAWTQVAGGSSDDEGLGLTVQGNRVYVTGHFTNDAANSSGVTFGGSGLAAGTAPQAGASASASYDVVAAGYLDNGPTATFAWSQVGGGPRRDAGIGAAVVGTRLYVGGFVALPATFGPLTLSTSSDGLSAFVGSLDLAATLATTAAAAPAPLTLAPNPAAGPALLSGAAPATGGQVVDALGRTVATFRTDAGGTAALPAGLPPGLYLVRVGAATGRWVVE